MKKLVLLLLITFPFILIGQDKYIDFQNDELQFSYPDTYTMSERRILQDISVKLISNIVSSDGGNDNIGVNLNSMYSSLNDIERKKLISGIQNELEMAGEKMGVRVQFTILSYDSKTIDGKEIIAVTQKTDFPDNNVKMFQMMYIYVKNKKSCFISLTSGTSKELYEKEQDINYILFIVYINNLNKPPRSIIFSKRYNNIIRRDTINLFDTEYIHL